MTTLSHAASNHCNKCYSSFKPNSIPKTSRLCHFDNLDTLRQFIFSSIVVVLIVLVAVVLIIAVEVVTLACIVVKQFVVTKL